MRRMAWWGTTAVLLACPTFGVAAAEKDTYQPPEPASKKRWWWPWGGSPSKDEAAKKSAKPEKEKPAEKPAKIKEVVEAPAPSSSSVVSETAASVSREQAKFIRRQQVCDRIREVAQESGNTELEKQAQLLEQRAWYLYQERTVQARLPNLKPLESNVAAKKLMNDDVPPRRRNDEQPIHSVTARSGSQPREE